MNLQSDEVVYVGDTYGTDVLGAYKVGMKIIWLNNYTNYYDNFDGVEIIHALSDLKIIL